MDAQIEDIIVGPGKLMARISAFHNRLSARISASP